MKKLPGAHRFLNQLVCDRCGHKTTGLDRISRSVMREHIKAKHEDAAMEAARQQED